MRRTLRRLIIGFLILAAIAGVAYQSRHKINLANFTWKRFIQSVGQADIGLLLLCVVLIYVCYAIRAVRWQRFCRYLGATKFWNTYAGTLMGFAAIFVLGRAGEPVRPLILARKERLPASGMFGIYFLERICDFAAAAALTCLCLLVFPKALSDAGADTDWVDHARKGAWFLLVGLLGVSVFLVYYRLHGASALDRWLARWHAAGGTRARMAGAISGMSEGLQAIRSVPDALAAVFYTAAHWGLVVVIYLLATRAFAGDFVRTNMNFPSAMLLLAVTLVGSALQIPGIGGGAQFASIIGLTKIFGVEQEPAVAIAVVLWLITFAGSTLAGIPLLIHEGMSVGELRKLAKAEDVAEEHGEHISGLLNNGVNHGVSDRQTTMNERGRGDSAR